MSREEQFKEYLKVRNIPIDSLEADSIMEGIEWADEHPKDGLVSIDKVCEWLKNNTWVLYKKNEYEVEIKNLLNDFRKAMEE